jgi:acetyl esterase
MENPYCSPLKADLTGLPPAFVLTCEHDSLLEEGAELVRRLNEVGVPCEYVNALGLDHGVFHTSRHHFPAVGPYQTASFVALKKALF